MQRSARKVQENVKGLFLFQKRCVKKSGMGRIYMLQTAIGRLPNQAGVSPVHCQKAQARMQAQKKDGHIAVPVCGWRCARVYVVV